MVRIGPCVDGSYPLLTISSMVLVWLGGQHLTPLKVQVAEWRSGRYQLVVEIGTVDHRVWKLKVRGTVDNADGLMGSLLGQLAKQIPETLAGGIERCRIVDFVFDQLYSRQRRDVPMTYRRLSKGLLSSLWLNENAIKSLLAKTPTSAQAFGEIMLHPAIILARQLGYCPIRACKGYIQEIVPDIYAQHASQRAIVVIDEKKPAARDEAVNQSSMGLIITGKRGGLEKWARRLAAREKRPLLIVSRQSHLEKVMHFLEGALLIETDNNDRLELGNLRANIRAAVKQNSHLELSA